MIRVINLLNRVRSSLWFFPSLMSLAAIALALGSENLDRYLATSATPWLRPFLYAADLEGARALLGTVAGSMITVAGVTFSVTMVALSLASSQFGPRLLVNFMRDRGNQLVLGTFIATFLYCLVALSRTGVPPSVVPAASASLGLFLAVASIAVLIFFFHHVASSIRAEHVVDVVAQELESAIKQLFPNQDDGEAVAREDRAPPTFEKSEAGVVGCQTSSYIQAIDHDELVALAEAANVVVHLPRRPGHFVMEGESLAAVVPADRLTSELATRIQNHFVLGRHRTGEQDPEYGIHQLVEVAVRALSPGINDPHTAVSCVDWLGSILRRVGALRLHSPWRRASDGTVRVVLDAVQFEGLLGASFDQIRQCCYSIPAVSMRVLEALTSIAGALNDPARAASVMAQADMLLAGALSTDPQKEDREALETRHRAVAEAVAGRTSHP